jgi:hypothetical protein
MMKRRQLARAVFCRLGQGPWLSRAKPLPATQQLRCSVRQRLPWMLGRASKLDPTYEQKHRVVS